MTKYSRMKKIIFLFACLATVGTIQAQERYGHLNFGNLISLMPETEAANSELKAYQDQLVAEGEDKAKEFQEEYAAFATDVQNGNLTPVQQQQRQQALETKQQEILAYEQEMSQKIADKRQELLGPIVQRAEETISEVAKANGFVMVFDTSIFGAVLFAKETEDVMPLVLAKLGIEMPAEGVSGEE